MTAPVNAAAIEAAKDAAMRFDLSLGRVKLAEAALTAALPFLRDEWETGLRAVVDEDMTRRIADCLEQHLGDYGFPPYRYPSGENKSILILTPGALVVSDDQGRAWRVEVRPAILTATTEPTT